MVTSRYSIWSRTLTRLRNATGDPLLVRAGRGLVPTPRAAELRDRVHDLTRNVQDVLSPHAGEIDVTTLARTFTIRAYEGFIGQFATALVLSVIDEAPAVRLCFSPKPEKNATPLREAAIDLEIGVLGISALEDLGLSRTIAVVVSGFPDALRIAGQSDLVALVPRTCLGNEALETGTVNKPLVCFDLPVRTPPFHA